MDNIDYKRYFNVILDSSKIINSSFDLNIALEKILETVTQSTNSEAASIMLLNKQNQNLYFKITTGNVANSLRNLTVKMGDGIVGWVAKNRKSLIIPKAKEDFRHNNSIDRKTGFITNSIIASPIEYQEEILGVLEIINPIKKTEFDQSDLVLLEALASQVAIAIRHCNNYLKINEENQNLKKLINLEHKIIGQSTPIKEILRLVEKVSPFDVTVLITGESGTGKELIAEAIHNNSPRKNKPFVAINCTALPENLIESELFGHERGAFTGAIARRKGKFEIAEGGTLFLDEIGDMGGAVQAKLLRVLESSIYERVGAEKPIKANVRIVAATNKDLKKLVAEGTFREDLYYRLNEILIHIPPLKNRKSDIPLLAKHFLNIFSKSFGKDVYSFTKQVDEIFIKYNWPGNIRELRNIVKSAVVLANSTEIVIEDLSDELKNIHTDNNYVSENIVSLDDLERNHIIKVFKENNWQKSKTAKVLKISRPTLDTKIKQYGILIEK